jgi:hypothetical protein
MAVKRLDRIKYKWTSNLAYAVGLLATDGYISKDNRHIVLTSSDYDQIVTFKKCLGKSNKITVNAPTPISRQVSYKVQIGDVVLLEWFKSIGIHNRKSLTIGELKIPDKLYPDFLRGSLDGDGHIRSYIDKYNSFKNPNYVYKRFFIFFNSASKNHLVWIRNKIFKLLKINGSFQEIHSKTQLGLCNMFAIKYSTKEAIKLANWMYYNSNVPCLKRKRDKFEEYLYIKN